MCVKFRGSVYRFLCLAGASLTLRGAPRITGAGCLLWWLWCFYQRAHNPAGCRYVLWGGRTSDFDSGETRASGGVTSRSVHLPLLFLPLNSVLQKFKPRPKDASLAAKSHAARRPVERCFAGWLPGGCRAALDHRSASPRCLLLPLLRESRSLRQLPSLGARRC